MRGKLNGRHAGKWTVVGGCFLSREVGRDSGDRNNGDRNFKDLEEMLGSAKELKRNNRECKRILIGPLMACTERKSLNQECGWKDGDRGGPAQTEGIHRKNKEKNRKTRLDSYRPFHGRH